MPVLFKFRKTKKHSTQKDVCHGPRIKENSDTKSHKRLPQRDRKLLLSGIIKARIRVSYWMDEKTEVDFICQKGVDNYAINCTYSNLEDPDLRERELKGLAEFQGDVKERILITEDIEDVITYRNKTITLLPFWKFLIFGL